MNNETNNNPTSTTKSISCTAKNISLFSSPLPKSDILALEQKRSDALNLRYDVRVETKALYFAMINQSVDFVFRKKWLIEQLGCGEYKYRIIMNELKSAGLVGHVAILDKTRYKKCIVLTSRVNDKKLIKSSSESHAALRGSNKPTDIINKLINNNNSSQNSENSDVDKRVVTCTDEVREILETADVQDAHIVTATKQHVHRQYREDKTDRWAESIWKNKQAFDGYCADIKINGYRKRDLPTQKNKIKSTEAFYTQQTASTLAETVKHALRNLDYDMGVDQSAVTDAVIMNQAFTAYGRYGKHADISVVAMSAIVVSYYESQPEPVSTDDEIYKECPVDMTRTINYLNKFDRWSDAY